MPPSTATTAIRVAILLALIVNSLILGRFLPNPNGVDVDVSSVELQQRVFVNHSSFSDASASIPLKELISSRPLLECRNQTFRFQNTLLPQKTHSFQIPHIIHFTSLSDCLTPRFLDNLEQWRFPGYSVVLHDDRALERLLQKHWPEFPHMSLVRPCMVSGAAKADLWRALVLWEYGGIYADIDVAPGPFFRNGTHIQPHDQAYFVTDTGTRGTLSQFFMAATPKHPLLFLIVQHILLRLLQVDNVGMQYVPYTTGPGAVKAATLSFLQPHNNNVTGHFAKSDVYYGIGNYTFRVVTGNTHKLILRDAVSGPSKANDYKTMGMVHFTKAKRRDLQESCLLHLTKQDLIQRGMLREETRAERRHRRRQERRQQQLLLQQQQENATNTSNPIDT